MKTTRFDTRSSEWIGDMTAWMQANAEDNSLQLERMKRNLRVAREKELTPRQQYMLELYYDQEMSVTEIAQELCVNVSTVSRTLQRARNRLRRYLQYSF
jgi:RNA polymerase sigma factor (sigma-70 family)